MARDLLVGREEVRKALARRYQHVLVDEFQDTDPLQIDILWQLCSEASKHSTKKPLTRALRPGALFLVGDPKQAIYRFRGADVNAYLAARKSIGNEALLEITTNFRSVRPILDFVNERFKGVLSQAVGQPGFSALSATHEPLDAAPAVAALDVPLGGEKPTASALRDAEADRVADLLGAVLRGLTFRLRIAIGGDHDEWNIRPHRLRFGKKLKPAHPEHVDVWRGSE